MTLIVGTPHWNGACFTSDTRETRTTITGDVTYEDDALKFTLLAGGIGMAAAGNKGLNVIFRSIVTKILYEDAKKTKYKSTDNPIAFFGSLTMKALKSTPKHPDAKKYLIPNDKTRISGLIGGAVLWLPLRIWQDEAKNLIDIILEAPTLNSVYTKHHQEILKCAAGEIPHKDFLEFPYSFVLMYNLVLDKDGQPIIWSIVRVPFGKIAAFGSGSKFPLFKHIPRVLGWLLFNQEADDIELAAMQLSQIHGYADKYIGPKFGFSFKDFGGGIIPGIATSKGVGVVQGEIRSKPDRALIADVYSQQGKLWVKTSKNVPYQLKEFPSIPIPDGVTLSL